MKSENRNTIIVHLGGSYLEQIHTLSSYFERNANILCKERELNISMCVNISLKWLPSVCLFSFIFFDPVRRIPFQWDKFTVFTSTLNVWWCLLIFLTVRRSWAKSKRSYATSFSLIKYLWYRIYELRMRKKAGNFFISKKRSICIVRINGRLRWRWKAVSFASNTC